MTTSVARRIAPAPLPTSTPTPFVKWVGGKGRLLRQLLPLLPPGAERLRHVEPFCGGGAMFFARSPDRALLCDINQNLVATYCAIRDRVEAVIAHLERFSRQHSKEHFYAMRERYNTKRRAIAPEERAALFVYLNKTCFNGLHRVNRRGHFNVPFGRYKNPRIVDPDRLRATSQALSAAEIRSEPFEALVALARPGDFVYLDPPYEPVSRTANFTGYAENGFGQDDQRRLRDVYRELDRRGCRLMLSNSDAPLIHELYEGFRIDLVSAARAVNCDPTKRGKVNEVVVRNY